MARYSTQLAGGLKKKNNAFWADTKKGGSYIINLLDTSFSSFYIFSGNEWAVTLIQIQGRRPSSPHWSSPHAHQLKIIFKNSDFLKYKFVCVWMVNNSVYWIRQLSQEPQDKTALESEKNHGLFVLRSSLPETLF